MLLFSIGVACSHIAPVSWLVERDIEAAQASLNFSDWPTDDAKRARKRMEFLPTTGRRDKGRMRVLEPSMTVIVLFLLNR